MKVVAALLLTLPFAAAECPNACSQHGECSMNDMCDCHSGFQGGDCSERVCQYNFAFVTTSNGDVNFDGDRYDGTVYTADTRLNTNHPAASLNSGGSVLLTQAAPGGTWENWPSFGKENEGHFYMECSNRGLCKRDTGDCECFPGYEGVACNRMACPDNCNGKGVCQTVKDFSASYDKWDAEMARSCKCDPGYAGISCAERQCPFSNDVLTKTNELVETQYVEIYSKCETIEAHRASADSTNGCLLDLALDATSGMLAGTFTLKFTDHYGQEYTTDPIDMDMGPTATTSSTVASKTQDALRALPNDVTSDTVTVTASTCGYAVDAQHTGNAAADLTADAFWTADDYFAIAANGITDIYQTKATAGKVLVTSTGANQFTDATGLATTVDQMVRYTSPICVRLKITFNDMPGNIAGLVVNTDSVTYDGFTNAMYPLAATHVASEVFDGTNKLAATGGFQTPAANTNLADISYRNPSEVTKESEGTIADKTVTFTATDVLTDTLGTITTFYPESVVEVSCKEASATYRSLGYYTISSMTKNSVTFHETVLPSACTTAADITITQISNIIAFGSTAYDGTAAADATGVPDVTKVYAITAGSRVAIRAWAATITDGAVSQFDSTVATTHHALINSNGLLGAAAVKRSWIILADDFSKMSRATVTPVKAQLLLDSDGTMENAECGDRGICDTDTGLCKCFQGYTGDSCQLQKAISA